MRGRRPGKTGGVFAAIHRGFFRAEHDADGRGSFAAVERSMSDRLLRSEIYTEGGGLVALLSQRVRREGYTTRLMSGISPQRFQSFGSTTIVFVDFVAERILLVEVLMVLLGRIEL